MDLYNEDWRHSGSDEDILSLEGSDDSAAVAKLAAYLKAHNVVVLRVTETMVLIEHSTRKFVLAPKLQEAGLDRIVIHEFWTANREPAGRAALLELANDLNNTFNTGAFYVDVDGDLAYQTQLTFLNQITWKEMDAFLSWHGFTIFAVLLSRQDDLGKFLA